jgi:sRNA-binding carbon storage regulator CsrA
MDKEDGVKRWKARAIAGGKEPTELVLARKQGEGFTVSMNGTTCEITILYVANNTVALLIETPEKNLVLRKELVEC